jgi:hypothetical protein
MLPVLLAQPLIYSSPQYCAEFKQDLQSSIKDKELLDDKTVKALYLRCLDTYTKGL